MKFIPKIVDDQFLVKVIQNQISPEEKEFFESWLQESDEHKEEFGNFVLLWDKIGKARIPDVPDSDKQFADILNKINSKELSTNLNFENRKPIISEIPNKFETDFSFKEKISYGLTWSLKIAASLFIIFSFYWLITERYAHNPSPVTQLQIAEAKPEKVEFKALTRKGERLTIPLPDGTIVYLNSNSRLKYPKVFDDTQRCVELEGEAYFSVAPNKLKPFKVITGNTITEVVGTEFNIKYRKKNLDVVVAKGIVRTFKEKSNRFIQLTKGQMVSFTPINGFSKPMNVNLHEYIAWRENKLAFKETPLREVMSDIEMFYNVTVVFNNPVNKNKKLTGLFDADSLDYILSAISISMDVDIEREGNIIKIN